MVSGSEEVLQLQAFAGHCMISNKSVGIFPVKLYQFSAGGCEFQHGAKGGQGPAYQDVPNFGFMSHSCRYSMISYYSSTTAATLTTTSATTTGATPIDSHLPSLLLSYPNDLPPSCRGYCCYRYQLLLKTPAAPTTTTTTTTTTNYHYYHYCHY